MTECRWDPSCQTGIILDDKILKLVEMSDLWRHCSGEAPIIYILRWLEIIRMEPGSVSVSLLKIMGTDYGNNTTEQKTYRRRELEHRPACCI